MQKFRVNCLNVSLTWTDILVFSRKENFQKLPL